MRSVFIAVRDYFSRSWIPVARVDHVSENPSGVEYFRLRYTDGATRLIGFEGFARMKGLSCEYIYRGVPPILKNRILPRSRPEFSMLASWLGRPADSIDIFDELAVTGGRRGTDSIEVFPCPSVNFDGAYEAVFFTHGIRYVSQLRGDICPGERVYPALDVQNPQDPFAILLRSDDPIGLIGYVPRYFSRDFRYLIENFPNSVSFEVLKVNPDAPPPFRILCRFRSIWPDGFLPCSDSLYQLLDVSESRFIE